MFAVEMAFTIIPLAFLTVIGIFHYASRPVDLTSEGCVYLKDCPTYNWLNSSGEKLLGLTRKKINFQIQNVTCSEPGKELKVKCPKIEIVKGKWLFIKYVTQFSLFFDPPPPSVMLI